MFDLHRTVITGFSVYPLGGERAYYVNLAHADVDNRVDFSKAVRILEAKNPAAMWVAHNAPYEIANFRAALGYELENVVCSMQACVSAYGPDEYDLTVMQRKGLGGMRKMMKKVSRAFTDYEGKRELTPAQAEVYGQIAGKTSTASHSYNGYVRDLAFGYGLKKAVESWFGHKMTTFKETLGQKQHMGELTGEETAAYGADDAYWAVRLLLEVCVPRMSAQNDQVLETFFRQENPMIYVFADVWSQGMRVNPEAIESRRSVERGNAAGILRELRSALSDFLPFPDEKNDVLYEAEGGYKPKKSKTGERDANWYANYERYRSRILNWVMVGDQDDDFDEVSQASGAVTKGWWAQVGKKGDPTGPNFTHYMTMRTVLYDLLGLRPMKKGGDVQSDGEARGRLIVRVKKWIEEAQSRIDETIAYVESAGGSIGDLNSWAAEASQVAAADNAIEQYRKTIRVIELIGKLAGVEQRMKLYLTPYSQLTDPETGHMYPNLSSLLASRRLASSNPNAMQLSKKGESTYIRGFYSGDTNDHLVVSLDWSQIELVLIGELSRDPEFLKAYGQLPYNDLHRVAAAQILSAEHGVQITPEQFASLRNMPDDVDEPFGFPLVDEQGNRLTPAKAYSWNRGTPGGKGANFGYWYSGALGSVATARGIGSDLMWEMTEAYRNKFAVAEEWRVRQISDAKQNGFVTLPDGHRRVRLECTDAWLQLMTQFFKREADQGVMKFANLFMKRVRTRAGNQTVNSLIQGSCATLIKRTILSTRDAIKERGLRARFMMPIHDELVWSVHKDDVWEFIQLARHHMTTHPDMFKRTVLHCTAAVGRTFEPFHKEKAPYGQIELDEAPQGLGFIPDEVVGEAMNEEQISATIQYLAEAA